MNYLPFPRYKNDCAGTLTWILSAIMPHMDRHNDKVTANSAGIAGVAGVAAQKLWAGGQSLSQQQGYIVGRDYDLIYFILAPLWALAIGLSLQWTPFTEEVTIWSYTDRISEIFLASLITAHLAITIIRSHFNPQVFHRFPLRFTLIPALLMAAMLGSYKVLICVSVLATFWDVYHSGMQTFGLARLYDVRAGNNPHNLRHLDIILNLLLYAGPIIGGATLMAHVDDFEKFNSVGALFLGAVPAKVAGFAGILTWCVVLGGASFLLYYLYCYGQAARAGYRVSAQKVALLVSTGVCSLLAWGFNPYGEAFFIMNVFHAVQYFAIIWWAERDTLLRVFRLGPDGWGKRTALVAFLGTAMAYGAWDTIVSETTAMVLFVAILHFWYDGFIWSVRRHDV